MGDNIFIDDNAKISFKDAPVRDGDKIVGKVIDAKLFGKGIKLDMLITDKKMLKRLKDSEDFYSIGI